MKLTDWIDGSKKPRHDGAYIRKYDKYDDDLIRHYCAFRAGEWYCAQSNPTLAIMSSFVCSSPYQNLPWKGLKEKP